MQLRGGALELKPKATTGGAMMQNADLAEGNVAKVLHLLAIHGTNERQ